MPDQDRGWLAPFARASRMLIHLLLFVANASLIAMVVLVALDVILRRCGWPIKGVVDVVGILGAFTIVCALPYTTAVKGHVAIEFFFQKFGRHGRMVLDTASRAIVLVMFCALTWQGIQYGLYLKANNQVTPTLQIPVFWVPWMFAVSFAAVALVKIYHILNPGKTMIKP